MIKMVSLELTNKCSKGCSFCYNTSHSDGVAEWEVEEVVNFAIDCFYHGVEAFSLGGGEPLEYNGLFEIIDQIKDKLYVTITTNGLMLKDSSFLCSFSQHLPDKIHLSLHNPQDKNELERIIKTVHKLEKLPVKSGVNLLFSSQNIEEATYAYKILKYEGLSPDRIILLPMKFSNQPKIDDIKRIISLGKFQAPSCLLGCNKPKEFCSVTWDKKVHPCSYSIDKAKLKSLDYKGLMDGLLEVNFRPCY